MKKQNCKNAFGGTICGTAVMGERGQLVIPKDARKLLGIAAGDKFLVLEHYGKIILIPEKQTRDLIEQITKHLK
jgi:AbrB family looped-hinge helix DNA binding protein